MSLKLGGISGIIASFFALMTAFVSVGYFGGKANLTLDGLFSLLFAIFSAPFVYALYKRLSKTSKGLASISLIAALIPILVSLFSNSQKVLANTQGSFDLGHPLFFVATVTWLGISTLLILKDRSFPKGIGYLGIFAISLLVVLFIIFIGNLKSAFPLAQNLFYINSFLIVPAWTLWVGLALIKIKSNK